jgi:hypothetical protein
MGMYFVIEYVDTVTGIKGEALSWEFAKTEDDATIKARAPFSSFHSSIWGAGLPHSSVPSPNCRPTCSPLARQFGDKGTLAKTMS